MPNNSVVTTITYSGGRINFFNSEGERIYSLVAANTSYHFRDDGTLQIEDGVDLVGIRDDPTVTTSPTFANIPAFIDSCITSGGSTVIAGVNDAGENVEFASTAEGHLEVAVYSPRLPFGSVHTENITPIFQSDAVYGVNNGQQLATSSGSGTATVTYTTGEQLLWTGHLGDTGEIDHHFAESPFNLEELTVQPGEWVTLAAKAVTGTPSYVTGSINTREDQ